FRIRALNSAGFSDYSSEVTATTQPPPLEVPLAPVLSATALSASRIDLSWTDVANEEGYKLERRAGSDLNWSSLATLPVNTISFSDSNLIANTPYTYRIRAFNSAGDSPNSAEM